MAPGAPQSDSEGRICIGRGLAVLGSSPGRLRDCDSGAVGTPGGMSGAGRVEPFSCPVAPAGGWVFCVLSLSLTMGATGRFWTWGCGLRHLILIGNSRGARCKARPRPSALVATACRGTRAGGRLVPSLALSGEERWYCVHARICVRNKFPSLQGSPCIRGGAVGRGAHEDACGYGCCGKEYGSCVWA